jgi:hypothetical protein
MTPPRILQVGLPFGNPVYIAAAFTAVVVTGEPTIVGPAIVVRSVLPLSEHITRGAADLVRSPNGGKARTVSPRPLCCYRLSRLACAAIRCRFRFLTDRRQRTARPGAEPLVRSSVDGRDIF